MAEKKTQWQYKGMYITELKHVPPDTYGFVYKIDIEHEGKHYYYIGQKKLISVRKRKFTKKEIAAMPNKRAKKWELVSSEMPWQSYTGSNKQLNSLIKEFTEKGLKMKKEILYYTKSALELKFLEAKEIICSGGLEDEQCFNDGVSLRQYGKLKFL